MEHTNPENVTTVNSKIRTIVMGRVYAIHTLYILLSTTSLSVLVFAISLWSIGREVWVSRVFQNTPSLMNANAVLHFYLLAFLDTRSIVQALTLITAAAFLWFIGSTVSMLRQASLVSASRFRLR
jgi:hypothetical protein